MNCAIPQRVISLRLKYQQLLQEGEKEKSLAQLFWLRRLLGHPTVTRHKFFTFLEKHILTMLQFGKILWNFLNDTMSSGAVCLLVLRQGW